MRRCQPQRPLFGFVLSHLRDKNKYVAKTGHPVSVAFLARSDYGFAASLGGSVR
jgi:hypothetical protein